MNSFIKNFLSGAASINLSFTSISLEIFQQQSQESLNEIKNMSELKKISPEKALKQYFMQRYLGQGVAFVIGMSSIFLMMWMAYEKLPTIYFIIPMFIFVATLIIPKIIVAHWEKEVKK